MVIPGETGEFFICGIGKIVKIADVLSGFIGDGNAIMPADQPGDCRRVNTGGEVRDCALALTCRKKIKPFFIKFFSFFKSGDMPCFSTGTLL